MKKKSNPLKYFNDKADERRKALSKAKYGDNVTAPRDNTNVKSPIVRSLDKAKSNTPKKWNAKDHTFGENLKEAVRQTVTGEFISNLIPERSGGNAKDPIIKKRGGAVKTKKK